MAAVRCLLPFCALLLAPGLGAIQFDHVVSQAIFVQTQKPTGEYIFEYDKDELFHVDADRKEAEWRNPAFKDFPTVDIQGALGNFAVLKTNLEISMKRSNNTPATNVPPAVTVFPKEPVELGQPNILVCFMKDFFPPAINVTWLKNTQPVTAGVGEADFFPVQDGSFCKFHYLTFVADPDDVYACSVEHWGLTEPMITMWAPEVPTLPSEAADTLVCALGLAVGIIGIIMGTVLIIKGMKHNPSHRRRMK
uniref:MHC class II antigen alpha chain n=1 Tax=Andrias davidianus TaxID=141262 RepID=U5QAV9_ANDDA|nr:MHC class II antigen alpha chain [Andrias davidianus]